MIVVVDGYNILKKMIGTQFASQKQQALFMKLLNSYAQKKNISLILVFDGGLSSWPEKYVLNPKITVIYAGKQLTADDYIKEYLVAHKKEDIVLASSDRELNRFAAKENITSLDASVFIQLLQETTVLRASQQKVATSLRKITDEYNEEVDALMQELGDVPQKKIVQEKNDLKKDPTKLSKYERELLKKLKKL